VRHLLHLTIPAAPGCTISISGSFGERGAKGRKIPLSRNDLGLESKDLHFLGLLVVAVVLLEQEPVAFLAEVVHHDSFVLVLGLVDKMGRW